jgi:hypothetical protein
MKTKFTDFSAWKKAVLAAHLVVYADPPEHEGMHESDMFNPSFATAEEDSDERYGEFCNQPNETEDGYEGVGYLFDSCDAYEDWCSSESDEIDSPTVANCDDWGTGEGRYHGRM